MDGCARILGICGAPCTGKTTLASWLMRKLESQSVESELLPELARLLAEQGVAIDKEMREPDYDAFLAAYHERDAGVLSPLAVADRTPVDHCSYLSVNRNMPPDFVARHEKEALAALERYRLLIYLPVQFPMRDDGFRETSRSYQGELDRAIHRMLDKSPVPVVRLEGYRRKRHRDAFSAVREHWPESFGQLQAAGHSG